MKIAYIFMKYPTPSEVFGDVEIKSLENHGVVVKKYSLFSGSKESSDCVYPSLKTKLRVLYLKEIISFVNYFLFALKINTGIGDFFRMLVVYPRALSLLLKLETEKFDVWHLFWGHYPSALLWLSRYKKLNVKVSIFTGAYDLVGMSGIMKWGVNNADIVFTHAECNLSQIKEFYNGNVHLSYRGVQLSDLNNKSYIERPFNCIRLCFSGRLIPSKKAELAIRVFANLAINTSLTMELHIFGDGPEKDNLQKLSNNLGLRESIFFHGHVSQIEMFKTFNKSHFMIFPSQHSSERLPNAVKEAMAHGIVPICGYTPGIDELINTNVDGFVIHDFTIDSCTNVVKNVIEDEKRFQSLSRSAVSKIIAKFDVDNIISEKIKLFNKVV